MNRIESLVVLSASAVRFHGFTQQKNSFFLAGTALCPRLLFYYLRSS